MRAAALRLGLNEEQTEKLLSLPNRSFVVQTPECPEPSLLEIPHIERKKFNLREIEAVTRERLSGIPYVHFDRKELESPRNVKQEWESWIVKDRRQRILRSFLKYPFISMEERCEREGIHPEEMGKEVSRQAEDGLVVIQSFHLGRGKPRMGAQLTEAGLKFIGAKENIPGRGSLQHRYIQYRLKEIFGNSCIESEGADLVVYEPGRKLAVEIELDAKEDHFLDNIRRNISSGFDRILVLAMTDKDVKHLRKKAGENLDKEMLRKVEFKTIGEVLKNGTAA